MFTRALHHLLNRSSWLLLAVAAVVVAGVLSYSGLKVDLFPPLNFPILNIITEIPSYSSFEIERQVTTPIESAASGVLGVQKVRSTSATGISMVSIEFAWGTDMVLSRQLLTEALAQASGQLPLGANSSIENLSATLSMIEGYSLQGGSDLIALRDQALYDLKPKLQRIPGVYKVVVMGGKVLEYGVYPNPALLLKYDLTLDQLRDALSNNNILASPGVVNHFEQELVIHSNGQFTNTAEIQNVVVAIKNGEAVRLKDLAQVKNTFQLERGDTSEQSIPSVLINIYKQPGFDTVQVASQIAAEIKQAETQFKTGQTIHNYYDQAELVAASIGSVKESVWIGAVLVVIVLGLFLHNLRSTIVATLSIPISVIAAIAAMRFFGIGLNIMSLGGLAIGTGIIVDDAIVVLENIFRWLFTPDLRKNQSVQEVIIRATAEVVRPVVVSTLTNIGIFLPMIFVEGFAGRLFTPVSLTVSPLP